MLKIEEWIARWKKTGILHGLPEDKTTLAVCAMSNQIHYNEAKGFPPAFNRLSIPILRRVIGGLQAQNVVSKLVENPVDYIVIDLEPFHLGAEKAHDGFFNLDREAEYSAMYCELLKNHIEDLASKVETLCLLGLGWNGEKVILYTE